LALVFILIQPLEAYFVLSGAFCSLLSIFLANVDPGIFIVAGSYLMNKRRFEMFWLIKIFDEISLIRLIKIFATANALACRSDTLGVSGCVLAVCLRCSSVIVVACWLLQVHVSYYMCMLHI
jgi:hypothetical protein